MIKSDARRKRLISVSLALVINLFFWISLFLFDDVFENGVFCACNILVQVSITFVFGIFNEEKGIISYLVSCVLVFSLIGILITVISMIRFGDEGILIILIAVSIYAMFYVHSAIWGIIIILIQKANEKPHFDGATIVAIAMLLLVEVGLICSTIQNYIDG